MSLGGQNFYGMGDFIRQSTLPYNQPEPMALAPVVNPSSSGKGGALAPEDEQALRYYIAAQPSAMPAFNNTGAITDPTAMAQQAILSRPMRPSFTGQPLLSREVPLGIQGSAGLAYPSMASTGLLRVPNYTSRYAGTDSGGGGGSGSMQTGLPSQDPYSLSNGLVASLLGLSAVPDATIPVDNMGTYANMPGINDFGAATQAEANAIADAMAAAQDASMTGSYSSAEGGGGSDTSGGGGGLGGPSDSGGGYSY